MPSVFALRALLGAGLGLGALDLVWINASLAPRLAAAPAASAPEDTIATTATDTHAIELDEPAPAPAAAAPLAPDAPPPEADEVARTREASRERTTERATVEIRRVYFDTGSATLRGTARKALARIAASAGERTTFVLEGHADYRGDERFNQSLSEMRAKEVQRHLIQLGIDPARIHVGYAGEGNETQELWRDRRVDIQITGGTR